MLIMAFCQREEVFKSGPPATALQGEAGRLSSFT